MCTTMDLAALGSLNGNDDIFIHYMPKQISTPQEEGKSTGWRSFQCIPGRRDDQSESLGLTKISKAYQSEQVKKP